MRISDHETGGSGEPSIETVTAGFIPLIDSSPLLVAAEKGFAREEGLKLVLVRETSWANIRDRVIVGHFDAAHMLGPLPIATSLGIGHLTTPMVAPFSFNLGGNAVTVSGDLYRAMEDAGAVAGAGPAAMGDALRAVVQARRKRDLPTLALGMVFPFSGHNYELRYWLAASGIDPGRDVRLVVLPPPFMAAALAQSQLDGFCVGEPWNSLAVENAGGVIITTKSELWHHGPEKVLGLRTVFAERKPEVVAALVRALWRATAWAEEPANHPELARLLAEIGGVGAPPDVIRRALAGKLIRRHGEAPVEVEDFLVFHRHAANFPWRSHALWFFSQMVRWGQIGYSPEAEAIAADVYRPDLYRSALRDTGADLPNASAKVEGALAKPTPVASRQGRMLLGPDGFFDGRPFDPNDVPGYLARLKIQG